MATPETGGPTGPVPDAAPDAVPVASEPAREAVRTAREAVPAREAVLAREPVLPEQSREDTDAGWGEYPELADDERYRDRPPHWDNF